MSLQEGIRYSLRKIHDLKKLKFDKLGGGDMSFCYIILYISVLLNYVLIKKIVTWNLKKIKVHRASTV